MRNLKKTKLKYGQSMGSHAIALNFLMKLEIRPQWLFDVGFREIKFLKWHDVINSNSVFLAIFERVFKFAFIEPS